MADSQDQVYDPQQLLLHPSRVLVGAMVLEEDACACGCSCEKLDETEYLCAEEKRREEESPY